MSGAKVGDTGASRRGYHYYDEFRECPRRFYYLRVLGLEAEQKKPALVKGLAMHAGQEAFMREDGLAWAAARAVHDVFEAEAGAFFTPEEALEAEEQVTVAVRRWIDSFGHGDLDTYETVAIEATLEDTIGAGRLPVTARIDRLMRRRSDGMLFLFDTKTSSAAGPVKIAHNAFLDDQLPLYAYLVRRKWGSMPDVIVDAVGFYREPVLERALMHFDEETIEDAVVSLESTMLDLKDRLAHVDDWRFAFPRHTFKCRVWGCPYEDVCRTGPCRGDALPGFRWVDPDSDVEETQGE